MFSMSLQDMVSEALAEATYREKLAQVDEPAADKKKEEDKMSSEESAKKKEEDKKDGEDESSAKTDLVEKVASAIDFINANIHQIDWEKVAVGEGLGTQKANAPTPMAGPGVGPGSDLQTNMESPTPGMQSTETGQATPQSQPPMSPGTDDAKKTDGQVNPDTAMETDMTSVPGGTGEQPQLKQAAVRDVRKLWAMRKHAAEEAGVTHEAKTIPLENPLASAAEEDVPKLPAPAQAQANLVQTTDPTAPINITKQQAKAEPKRQMGEVLDEPAQKKSTDSVLHENLDAASTAGVKLSAVQAAAARTYLRKVAQVGESPEATPEEKEKAKKLKEAVEAKKNEDGEKKEKESMFGGNGASAMPPPPPPTSPTS